MSFWRRCGVTWRRDCFTPPLTGLEEMCSRDRVGIHIRPDLVMKERVWVGGKWTRSHCPRACGRWEDENLNIQRDGWVSGGCTDMELIERVEERQLGDVFTAPPTPGKLTVWSDVITTAYTNQLCDLMGCVGFKFQAYVFVHVWLLDVFFLNKNEAGTKMKKDNSSEVVYFLLFFIFLSC